LLKKKIKKIHLSLDFSNKNPFLDKNLSKKRKVDKITILVNTKKQLSYQKFIRQKIINKRKK
jgi:hypothetical protein